jgi:hypothetical protein
MNDVKTRGRILWGREVTALDRYSIFDRIINLKFIRAKGDGFTLRSDYEIVTDRTPAGNTHVVRIKQKPEIKLSYKQVANTVAIEVDVEVTNLFFRTRKEGDSAFAAEQNPVETIIAQVGYINQFPDWTKASFSEDRKMLSKFYNLEDMDNFGRTTEEGVNSGRQIVIQVLSSYTKGNPPDHVTYFQGIIGTMENALRWAHEDAGVDDNYGQSGHDMTRYSEIEKVLLMLVTRRFIKPSVVHRIEDDGGKQTVTIYGYKDYTDKGGGDPDTAWTALTLDGSGVLSWQDAERFGVTCSVSDYLKRLPANKVRAYTPGGVAVLGDNSVIPVIEQQNSVGSQLVKIQGCYPDIRWYEMSNGNYYIYHVSESQDALFRTAFVRLLRKNNLVTLPAIYDMTFNGTRQIRCPFISFISPLQTVRFRSRYAIGTLVGYYYHPKEEDDFYMVLQAQVEVSTTGDENDMTLVCTDAPSEGAMRAIEEAEAAQEAEEEKAVQEQRKRNRWYKDVVELVPFVTGKRTNSSWSQVAVINLIQNVGSDEDPAWIEQHRSLSNGNIREAMLQLKEWNRDGYFGGEGGTNGRRYDLETAVYGFDPSDPEQRFPVVYPGEKIRVQLPWRAAYPGDAEVAKPA